MNRPEAYKLFADLLDARERNEHGDFFYEHLEDLCDAAILAVADIDPDETDWFGKVRWCDADIVDALQFKLINPTDKNVSRVRAQLGRHSFSDAMIEHGWEFIYTTIDNLHLDEDESQTSLWEKPDDLPDEFDFYSHINELTKGKKYHAIRCQNDPCIFLVSLEDGEYTWKISTKDISPYVQEGRYEIVL